MEGALCASVWCLRHKENRQLRVCYLTESFYPIIGGAETQSQLIIEQFVRQSIDLIVITRHTLVNSAREETLFGARVLRIPPSGGKSGVLRWLMMFTAFLWLIKERRNFDIIFVGAFRTLGVSAVLAGKLFDKRIVLKPENIGEMSGAFFDGRLTKIGLSHSHWLVKPIIVLRNNILKRANAFCPISSDLEKELLQAGIAKNNVYLIPNAYDSSRFFPISASEKITLRKKSSIDEKRPLAIFIGRLVSWKGPQHLVRMWHEIVAANNHPLLLLVGPDSSDMFNCGDEIRNYISTHDLQNDIIMTGGVRNVEEYLRMSDFYVFPSQGGEGLPTALIEAMACGLPIITTRATGVIDLVTPETGLIVEPTDFEGFKAAITRMLREEKDRSKLGQAAAEKVKRIYSPENVHSQYLRLFHSLTPQHDA